MFRGSMDKTAAFQALKEFSWKSPSEMQEIAGQLIEQGTKLPMAVLFELYHQSLNHSDERQHSERVQLITNVLNKISFDAIVPHYDALLTSFEHDKNGYLTQNLDAKFITRKPDLIIDHLRQKKGNLQKVAFRLIVTMGKGTIFRELEEALRKDNWEDKKIGLFALREIAGARAIPTLISFLQGTGKEKYYALELLADNDNIQVINAIFQAGQKSKDPEFKIKVAWALGQTNSPRAIRPLMEMVEDENMKVRIQSIRSLAQIRDDSIIKPLQDLLNHQDYRIRREAVTVAAKNADIRLLPLLVEKLRDVQQGIREQTIETLATLGREGRIDKYKIVIALMQNENTVIRSRLKDVLSIFHDEDLMSQLVRSLAEEDWWVRQRVAATLLELAEDGGTEYQLTDPLVGLLEHENEITRRFAVEVLEKLKDPRSVDALLKTLEDPDWWVRERAIEALGNIGDPRALKHLVAVLKDEVMRYSAVVAIGKFKEPQTIKALTWVLRRSNRDVKIEAIKSLLSIGTAEIAEPIQEMLQDEDIRVRLEASTAMGKVRNMVSSSMAVNIDVEDQKVVPLLDGLLLTAKKEGATDLYVLADYKPYMRRHGEAQVVYPMHLSPAETEKLLTGIINDEQKEIFKKQLELDFSYIIEKKGRFRANLFVTRAGVSGVFRIIPDDVPTMEDLKLPPVLRKLADFHQGLVLITGAACQGKSTTMAAIIDIINKRRRVNILSIEEPIEYIHKMHQAQITQREIGNHTHSFARALRSALRQDPDVIAIGELRDLESIAIAITAAETGHLVLGTLHAFSASKTVDRIIGVFPQEQQNQIRLQLAETVRAVVSQQLVTTVDGRRRASLEIMFANTAIRKLIRDRKTEQLPSLMVAAADEGMITMDHYLLRLFNEGVISESEAIQRAHNRGDFERLLEMQKEQGKDELKSRLVNKVKPTNSTTRINIDRLTGNEG